MASLGYVVAGLTGQRVSPFTLSSAIGDNVLDEWNCFVLDKPGELAAFAANARHLTHQTGKA